ncbi:MAG: bifunctional hydroxymethylpyrimidine kinase/phosphomethylpyrimidine kinase [Lachnospiraceae bacterium]|nr:bifunctional hydroxymethylpyrimidine kinase/phosphomethylpyrimidine kinase [Lachnospiraceae bacterium]
MKTALTIAGSDCSGGAGIQADLKTMTMNGVYAMSAITALTAQNTTGVTGILTVDKDFLAKQLDAVFTDIVPDAVKIGMVASSELIGVIADKLEEYGAKNIVADPVMVATSGSKLIADEAIEALKERILPLAALITPNIPEAEILSGLNVLDEAGMEKAAQSLAERFGCAVLVKGGHQINDANDVLFTNEKKEPEWFRGERVNNPNTHGTGCTLSSAIASFLAKGCSLSEAIKRAKAYLTDALSAGLDLGKGAGPLAHNFALLKED